MKRLIILVSLILAVTVGVSQGNPNPIMDSEDQEQSISQIQDKGFTDIGDDLEFDLMEKGGQACIHASIVV